MRAMRSANRSASGCSAKAAGDAWEAWIQAQHEMAWMLGILAWSEHHEPHGKLIHGQWKMVRPGGADFGAVLCPLPGGGDRGRSAAMEAKSVKGNYLSRDEITDQQGRHLTAVALAGSLSLLMVEFRLPDAPPIRCAVPWLEVPWRVKRTAESFDVADCKKEWLVGQLGECYLSRFHPGGPRVGEGFGDVGRRRVFPRE